MRGFKIAVVLVALGIVSGARAAETFGPIAVPPGFQSFRLGDLALIMVRDGQFVAHNDGKTFGVDVGPGPVGEILKASGLPDDRIALNVNALVVYAGVRVILIDTGLGPKVHGALLTSMKMAGVAPDAVTDVLITHSHGDHVGGLVDAAGKPAFPKATIRMAAAEWTWMKSQPQSADLVKAIESHVKTFTPGKSIAPGVTAIALAGHTPGHVGYEVASGKDRLLDIGDLAHSSLVSLKKPEWTMGFDNDAAVAKATRKATLTRLAKSQELVFAPHFPYPGVGHVVADGDGFKWKPGTP
jgi:glyoxylase-like metal-dependent hydrolase (beta-lactamase superfamily II)